METLKPKLRFPEFTGDWGNYTMEQLTVKIGDGLHGTPQYVENSDVYFINGNNLIDGKIVINENSKKVSVETLNKNNKGLDENSILISINGTIGCISRYNNEKIMLGKSVGYFNFKQSKDFYFHILQSNKIQDYFISELTGSTIKNLSLKTLRETNIYQPSLEEQTRIANFLSSVDEKINLLKEKKSLLEDYKKGIMQKIFNQELRFKDDDGNDFDDWEEILISELTNVIVGGTPSTTIEEYWNGDIAWLSSGELNNGLVTKAKKHITEIGLKNSSAKIMKPNTVMLAMTGATLGKIGFLTFESCGNQSIAGFEPNNKFVSKFFYYNILFNKNLILSMAGGAAQQGINKASIESLFFTFPNIQEQTKIANFLSAIDEKIELVSNQIQDTLEYKKGLLQQMFV